MNTVVFPQLPVKFLLDFVQQRQVIEMRRKLLVQMVQLTIFLTKSLNMSVIINQLGFNFRYSLGHKWPGCFCNPATVILKGILLKFAGFGHGIGTFDALFEVLKNCSARKIFFVQTAFQNKIQTLLGPFDNQRFPLFARRHQLPPDFFKILGRQVGILHNGCVTMLVEQIIGKTRQCFGQTVVIFSFLTRFQVKRF